MSYRTLSLQLSITRTEAMGKRGPNVSRDLFHVDRWADAVDHDENVVLALPQAVPSHRLQCYDRRLDKKILGVPYDTDA